MSEFKATNSIINFGNNSQFQNINISGGNENNIEINWEKLSDDLFSLLKKIPDASPETKTYREAIKYSAIEDKPGFIAFVKKHSGEFTSALFSNTASVFLVDIIKKILNC